MTVAHKVFTPHELKLDESGAIRLAFAQLGVIDSDHDVTLAGAFPAGKAVPMSAYGHTSWEGALPPGKGSISEAGDWAVFDGQFLMETDHGRNTYHTVKALAELQEFSYGYEPLKHSYGQQDGQQVRFLERLDVFEVSPVLRGAGLGTHVMTIKSGAPGADAPYATQLSWYSDGLPALLDRVKARADFRSVEGRKLSRSDRAQLAEIEEAMTGHLDQVRALIAIADEPKAADRLLSEVMALIGEAEALGVPIPA